MLLASTFWLGRYSLLWPYTVEDWAPCLLPDRPMRSAQRGLASLSSMGTLPRSPPGGQSSSGMCHCRGDEYADEIKEQ